MKTKKQPLQRLHHLIKSSRHSLIKLIQHFHLTIYIGIITLMTSVTSIGHLIKQIQTKKQLLQLTSQITMFCLLCRKSTLYAPPPRLFTVCLIMIWNVRSALCHRKLTKVSQVHTNLSQASPGLPLPQDGLPQPVVSCDLILNSIDWSCYPNQNCTR